MNQSTSMLNHHYPSPWAHQWKTCLIIERIVGLRAHAHSSKSCLFICDTLQTPLDAHMPAAALGGWRSAACTPKRLDRLLQRWAAHTQPIGTTLALLAWLVGFTYIAHAVGLCMLSGCACCQAVHAWTHVLLMHTPGRAADLAMLLMAHAPRLLWQAAVLSCLLR